MKELTQPNPDAVARGMANLEKHIENLGHFQVPGVVAVNRFTSDTDAEIQVVLDACTSLGTQAVVADVWARGGEGAEDLAAAVAQTADSDQADFRPLYRPEMPVEEKIQAVCTQIYGADGVEYSSRARADLRRIRKLGLENLPVCMAKTQKSLSDDPKKIGRPTGFEITVREIEIAAGAGFLIPITGDMMRMPGLPATPSAEKIDIDDQGNISGLF